ncbi:MAG: hypothetical protein JOZ78_07855 [Chroococcidiopsidaceae cyanobacterium CP_BM_ER_R8_30]|nr:hypothetical protein [Chroococcidiopsidaceae cyanobacterium CP_BM_ER_R8_30]
MRRSTKILARLQSVREIKRHQRYSRWQISQNLVVAICLMLILATTGITWMLTKKDVTLAGVPIPLIIKAFSDTTAVKYFILGDKRAFHDRLEQMGLKEEIKAFYRPEIHNEIKLDQYIHQIFYNDTGYVGDAYYVNSQGILTLKNPAAAQAYDPNFDEWYPLALQAGVVIGSKNKNGIQYVISPTGTEAPYNEVAATFPPDELRNLIQAKQQK